MTQLIVFSVTYTALCFHVATSAISRVTFLQILDTSKLVKEKTKKIIQWKQLETSINNVLPLKNSRITTYRILTTDELERLDSIITENL